MTFEVRFTCSLWSWMRFYDDSSVKLLRNLAAHSLKSGEMSKTLNLSLSASLTRPVDLGISL